MVLLTNRANLNPKFSPTQLLRIKEFEGIEFKFPNLVLCKGNLEFININLNESTLNYFTINSPLFVKSMYSYGVNDAQLSGLVDLGFCMKFFTALFQES